jgi:glycosyltransferase involved in cell wall biosynthesis
VRVTIMRLAVFTAEFPGRINTFFARDLCALLRAGVEIDIFPIYPLHAEYWSAVPEYLNEDVLPRHRVHHVSPLAALRHQRRRAPWGQRWRFVAETSRVRASAVRFGPEPFVKSEYVYLKAWAWARAAAERGDRYDHVLAYWGNYAATAAYLFQRLIERDHRDDHDDHRDHRDNRGNGDNCGNGDNGGVPFSMVLHAHDLYERQVFLDAKLERAANVFVVCEFNRRFLAARFPQLYPAIAHKIHLHHLGLDVGAITPAFEGRAAHNCLAVGRLDPSKGFDDLLRAAAIVRDRGLDLDVTLVGDGEQASALRRLASSLRIADRVHFRGWLTHDAVPEAMRASTMLVHPSRGLGDAVPTVIKEAMALGTPVIGSTAVGIPELLDGGRCGLLVPERSPERLADAIAQMLRDAVLRDRLARAGRAFAERTFDLWQNGERLAGLLSASPLSGTQTWSATSH